MLEAIVSLSSWESAVKALIAASILDEGEGWLGQSNSVSSLPSSVLQLSWAVAALVFLFSGQVHAKCPGCPQLKQFPLVGALVEAALFWKRPLLGPWRFPWVRPTSIGTGTLLNVLGAVEELKGRF